MQTLTDYLAHIELGNTQDFKEMGLTPIFSPQAVSADYLTLDEALQHHECRISELGDGGSVAEVRFENRGDKPIFLLDGEELVGAKQNRIINISLLVPARCVVQVPVSCVEAGRWSHTTDHFSSKDRTLYSKGRAHKAVTVSASLDRMARPLADQSAVWEDIDAKSSRMASSSETQAMDAMFDRHATSLDEYVAAFTNQATQVGAAFSIRGQINGIELFDSSDTWAKLSTKLIRSYALDALDSSAASPTRDAGHTPDNFISRCSNATTQTYLALAEGEDIRLSGPQLAGGALLAYDRIVHLCAFNLGQAPSSDPDNTGDLQRPSVRRSHYFD